jgi:hypothetical protein
MAQCPEVSVEWKRVQYQMLSTELVDQQPKTPLRQQHLVSPQQLGPSLSLRHHRTPDSQRPYHSATHARLLDSAMRREGILRPLLTERAELRGTPSVNTRTSLPYPGRSSGTDIPPTRQEYEPEQKIMEEAVLLLPEGRSLRDAIISMATETKRAKIR